MPSSLVFFATLFNCMIKAASLSRNSRDAFSRASFRGHQTVIHFFAQTARVTEPARTLSRAFIDFCRGALGRVRRFYAARRRKSRFSKNPRHTANITSRYVNPTLARSLLRSANRRQYLKLRRRLNISIPDPKQRGEVRIKSTSPALFLPAFLAETKNYPGGYKNKTHFLHNRAEMKRDLCTSV